KSTTMKMLTGLLHASEGEAWVFGQPVDPKDIDTRRRVGYMSQAFSLIQHANVFQTSNMIFQVLGGRIFVMRDADQQVVATGQGTSGTLQVVNPH
ncbi:hypothetical protein O5269_26435, partial [Escherichia coli]|nr:hypothetical protein [Escherichia coli]